MARHAVGSLLLLPLIACGDNPTTPIVELPDRPAPLSPIEGAQASRDRPTLLVRNARGFDAGQASYAFTLRTPGGRELLSASVPAGSGTTAFTPATPLPRGHRVEWSATASGAAGQVTSNTATFRTVSVSCLSGADAYAKSVVDVYLSECSLSHNLYNDPSEALGPPDAGGSAPDRFFGFISLGEKGYVSVDLEGCAVDEPGPDVRVFQTVSREAVTLYAAGSPTGPFELLEAQKPCGTPLPGVFSRYCDFDLAVAEVSEARYFRIEDGEHFPCALGTTVTEGADIDAIEILHLKP